MKSAGAIHDVESRNATSTVNETDLAALVAQRLANDKSSIEHPADVPHDVTQVPAAAHPAEETEKSYDTGDITSYEEGIALLNFIIASQ